MENLFLQSPGTGDHILRQKFCRKPLQPKNSLPTTPLTEIIQILKPKPPTAAVPKDSDKAEEVVEKHRPVSEKSPPTIAKHVIEPLDSSLAEELSAIRKKVERLKVEREKTEKMLNERDKLLGLKMKEMQQRFDVQRTLEIEVDRLFRLKELHFFSTNMRISPIRTLREKELDKKNSPLHCHLDGRSRGVEESSGSTVSGFLESPCLSSSSSSNSVSSQLVMAVK